MAVTDYRINKCRYIHSKLKNVIYLVSAEHIKNIHIDNGEAYIDGLTELPLRINGFNIQLNETTSLDERYRFQKTLTLSMTGYVSYKIFGGRYYAIIEDNEGTFYMVNVDFPSRITHTFNLSKDTNQTDFTFSSLSNYPTLKLNAEFEAVAPLCIGLNTYGIDSLKLLETDKARLDVINRVVSSTEPFKTIEFMGNSCSFQEIYDGEKVTDTITFDIPLNNRIGWSWNLLEFLENKYAAIIAPKNNDNVYYSGFNFGLEPSYVIQTANQNGESDIITVTLTESSTNGATSAVDWDDEHKTETRWRYVKKVGQTICYECIGFGRAKYLVKQEIDYYGNPTGNYQVMEGYESHYPNFHIVGTFSTEEIFETADCTDVDTCDVTTTLPYLINFNATTCYTYSFKASCDWRINNFPSYITVSPTSGVANTDYTLSICNTLTPSSTMQEGNFEIACCNSRRIVQTQVQTSSSCIRPTVQNINCLDQSVQFTFDGKCMINVTNIDSRLTYSMSNNVLTVQVPRNFETSAVTWTISVTNCNCSGGTNTVTIVQDKTYEKWVTESGYMCVSGDSYTVERRYTGTSADNISVRTDEQRAGTLIQSGDTACSSVISKFEWDGNYYCVDGNKFKVLEEMVSYDNGTTWIKTGVTRLGDFVESASTFCNQAVTYKWVLTSKWQCEEDRALYETQYLTFKALESGTFTFNPTSGNTIQYSLDNGSTWTTLASGASTPTIAAGNKVLWKGTMTPTSSGIGYFSSTGNFDIEGNIMSLLYGDNFIGQTSLEGKDNAFASIFSTWGMTKIVNAKNLILPATTLSTYCYGNMFAGCSTLITAPELPATTLANYCYSQMFFYCSSLTTAPELPATTLANFCYQSMFQGCSSLTTAPELPATTLAGFCYNNMFQGCTSLNYIKMLATDISATDCLYNWVGNVASSGTFVKASSMESLPTGSSGIPNNWTVVNN